MQKCLKILILFSLYLNFFVVVNFFIIIIINLFWGEMQPKHFHEIHPWFQKYIDNIWLS